MKIIIYLFLISLFGFLKLGVSQNLVPNGSFEKHIKCPYLKGQLVDSIVYNWDWDWGSPDYFCECVDNQSTNSAYMIDVPLNYVGFQHARTGTCYVGFGHNVSGRLCGLPENIKTNLSQKMVFNQKYYFSAYVSLSDASEYSMDGIDIYISNDSSLIPYRINSCTYQYNTSNIAKGKGYY